MTAPHRRRWFMLALGVNAHAGVTLGLSGLPLVIPDVQRHFAVSLPVAGVIANAPGIGILFALVAWGALADRYGERLVLGLGVGSAALLFAAAAVAERAWAVVALLALAGAAGCAALVGGGRIVLRWFEPPERGVAMGVRQISYTLGIAVAGFTLPPVARAYGISGVMLVCSGVCLLAAVLAAAFLAEPPHAGGSARTPAGSPYRQPALWRVHATSALHVVPQIIVGTYGVVCLVEVYGWDGVAAGRLFAAAAVAGAVTRVAAGRWSDLTGLRMAPLRLLTLTTLAALALLVLGTYGRSWLGVVMLALAAVVSVAGNGLAYLAAGELAGPAAAGRVLGAHNTAQNVVALAVVPLAGMLITQAGYWVAFAVALACTLISIPVIPVRHERATRSP
ncbi:MFS transporter [Nonomuraea sp. MCN248]|uniref:MFS transporter n=1 Tax=Nonomuraea corallina TaxID=2989783 RepID=A0ABT4SBN0_9ACTN|nr:MFS transporter [Nonomuraea corallina]MDA0634606.1 MFS transporter [Nonomuraea corallina]